MTALRSPRGKEDLRLLIMTFDPPENVGGVEGRAHGYVRELTRIGKFVVVEAVAPSYCFSTESFEGAQLHKCSSGLKEVLRSFEYTRRLITENSISSVFLLSGGITILGNIVLLYCRVARRTTAMLLYGKDVLQARKGPLGRFLLASSQFLANRVVTNSHYTSSLLSPFFQRKVAVLYPAVDPRVTPQAETSLKNGDERRILFVGRLVRRKAVDDLINAFRLLLADFPDARLDIVGDGPERARLERLVVDLRLGESVIFFGTLRGEALHQRYRHCELVAMPSRTMKDDVEGFGTVFLESGLAGRASVGTISGGIPEAILDGKTGILVREGNVKDLAAAMKKILGDEGVREGLGKNARARVLAEFTWERSTQRLLSIVSGRPST